MRQSRLMELIKDYDFSINYHPRKVTALADALCKKPASKKEEAFKKKKATRKQKSKMAALRCSLYTDLEKLSMFDF